MPEEPSAEAFRLDVVDYEAIYQGRRAVPGSEVIFETAPWDIAGPQPVVVDLQRSGQFVGEILDVGCGLGEHTLYLASRGHRVVGVDAARSAVVRARESGARRRVDAEFVHCDATELVEFADGRFSTVLDSALYHCLGADRRREYAAVLHRVTARGGRLHLLCLADDAAPGFRMMGGVSREDLQETLSPYWDISDVRSSYFVTALTRPLLEGGAGAALAGLGMHFDPDLLDYDALGRVLAPVWQLRAVRRE
ncbi:class I SAM-dependent methyltransferase [Streptomyces sp. RS2]|uniref:class I SAM-dependent methyltransferase n=1 Tax=Streptomyces sp. RS2 TaxID=1451205 RepID=UPI0013E2EB37|nr:MULTISPECIES: class I SAM-dependent methyltransferase [unclassified Streptomyces]MCW1094163.1 class I SAM-dependent methyltransferase [Streptomyces sp. RS2]